MKRIHKRNLYESIMKNVSKTVKKSLSESVDVRKGLTVKDLYNACRREITNGNGDKHILLSGDDEGNSYHELFFLFSQMSGSDIAYGLPFGVTEEDVDENYIVLG